MIARDQKSRKTRFSVSQLARFAATSLLVHIGSSLNLLHVITYHLCELNVTWYAYYPEVSLLTMN